MPVEGLRIDSRGVWVALFWLKDTANSAWFIISMNGYIICLFLHKYFAQKYVMI